MKKFLILAAIAFVGAFGVTFVVLTAPGFQYTYHRQLPFTPHEETRSASVLFTGDLMFDRFIRTALDRSGDELVLGGVKDLLAGADLTAGNLEGPITDHASQSQGTGVGAPTNMRFTFSPTVREILLKYRFGLVSIGNNHIRDFGPEGVAATTNYLSSVGIAYIGDPTGNSAEPVVKELNGVKLAFVSYSDFVSGDSDRTIATIVRAREAGADSVIVMSHWGNEYETAPPERVRSLAHQFAASGADLIIGTHPHVIGEVEDIGSTRAYYSLGNFVFDQYFNADVRCGLAVEAIFTKQGLRTTISYEETEVGMREDGRTVLGCR